MTSACYNGQFIHTYSHAIRLFISLYVLLVRLAGETQWVPSSWLSPSIQWQQVANDRRRVRMIVATEDGKPGVCNTCKQAIFHQVPASLLASRIVSLSSQSLRPSFCVPFFPDCVPSSEQH